MSVQTIKVAIQGDVASFHEIAALEYYQQPTELMYCGTFREVFEHLLRGRVDKAFVATENSSHGEIEEVKRLLEVYDVSVEGRHPLRIQQHLIGHAGTDMSAIQKVISHPVALSQCDNYIGTSLSKAEVLAYHDTAAAVAYVKNTGDQSMAAIGSSRAAEVYGLDILSPAIQNDPDNCTIFQSLCRKS